MVCTRPGSHCRWMEESPAVEQGRVAAAVEKRDRGGGRSGMTDR